MPQKTPLYQQHLDSGAQLVDFCGWNLPINYGSQLEEHQCVRQSSGMFDVSHMTIIDISGNDSPVYLRKLLANDIAKLKSRRALYTCMLNPQGGIIDDMIVYYRAENHYRLVVNAGSRDQVWQWINQQAESYQVKLEEQKDSAIIAVQGPEAINKVALAITDIDHDALKNMRPFSFIEHQPLLIARTGYTGEDGVEIMLPANLAATVWQQLLAQNVTPCGLGARDSLRLEAGFNLYGCDMDQTTSPLESNLAWTVSWKDESRDFIGKSALQAQREKGVTRQLVGLMLEARGMMRAHQGVLTDKGKGEITSGGFSPSLGFSIALARIPITDSETVSIDARGKQLTAKIIKPPFIGGKNG